MLEDLVSSGEGVVSDLIAALDDPDPEARSGAALALGHISFFSDEKYDFTDALPRLAHATEDDDPWVVLHSARSLWHLCGLRDEVGGVGREDIAHRIAVCLKCRDPLVRVVAVEHLGIWGHPFHELLISEFVALLDDAIIEVRMAAASLLSQFGPEAGEAMPTLMEWVNSERPEERFMGSFAVSRIDEAYDAALAPVVLDAFEFLEASVRGKALCFLSRRRELVAEVAPVLERWYEESDGPDLRLAIVGVLTEHGITVKGCSPILLAAVRDKDREVAKAAVRGMVVYAEVRGMDASGLDLAVLVPELIALLDGELATVAGSRRERNTRQALIWDVCDLLGHIGPAAVAAVPYLKRAMRDECRYTRLSARKALRNVRPKRVTK